MKCGIESNEPIPLAKAAPTSSPQGSLWNVMLFRVALDAMAAAKDWAALGPNPVASKVRD